MQSLGGSIVVGGTTRVSHQNVETVNVANAVGAPPVITITSPTADPTFASDASSITLAGTATDDTGIASVTWVNNRGGSGSASGTTSWTASGIPLAGGVNIIAVTATDLTGNSTTDTLTVTVTQLTYLLAEGSTGAFFDLDVLIANPNAQAAPIVVTFFKEDGTTITQNLTIAATSQLTLHVDQIAGLEGTAVSTLVTSTAGLPLVVERSMFWDSSYYGSHGATAVDGAHTRWYFAEGSQGFFSTFLLLANSSAQPATVTVSFLTESNGTVQRTFQVAPTARLTVAAGLIPELVNRSFAMVVDSNVPIVAERAMYFGTARFWDGGHESAGVSEPSAAWFLAEGATGSFFDTFVLIANPNPTPTDVVLRFLTDQGQSIVRNFTVAANARLTVNMEEREPAAGQRRGVDDHRGQPADHRRARDVLAGQRAGVERGAQQLRRHRDGHEVGPGGRAFGHGQGVRDLHPAGQPQPDDRGAGARDLPANGRGAHRADLHGEPDLALQHRREQPRAGARQRVVRRAHRGHQRRRDRRRAVALQRRARPGVGGGHQRPRHAPAVTG